MGCAYPKMWVDTQVPASGTRRASGTWGVVFSLEARTLGREPTPELLQAPETIL